MRLFKRANTNSLAKEAVGYSNQQNFNPAPPQQGQQQGQQPNQGQSQQTEGYTIPYDCPDSMCTQGKHPLKVIGLNGDRVTAICEKSGHTVQLIANLKNGQPEKNSQGQIVIQTAPTSNQAQLQLSAGADALNPLPAKRPRLKRMDDPTGLSTQVRRNDSIMNKTPNNMTSGNYEKVAQKRNIDGIPSKDSYKGPRVFRMHEDVGPQGTNTIAPFTKEREEYKNEHKVIQSTAAGERDIGDLFLKQDPNKVTVEVRGTSPWARGELRFHFDEAVERNFGLKQQIAVEGGYVYETDPHTAEQIQNFFRHNYEYPDSVNVQIKNRPYSGANYGYASGDAATKTAAPIFGPDNLPPSPPLAGDGFMDGGEPYTDEELDSKSDFYCTPVGGEGLESLKIVKGRNEAEVYDFLSERFPHVKSWDISYESNEAFIHDPDAEHLDVDADSASAPVENSMPQTMPLDSIQRTMASAKDLYRTAKSNETLTKSEVALLAQPHTKFMSESAKSQNLKTAAMYDQVSLLPGSGPGLCQWCPKLRASVQMTTCATKCIDARRIPQEKSWENYSDYIANGGDPDGKIICGYKEWMAREMDKFYPGWVEDHIKKMGGEVIGSETNYGNRRMNLDEGERRHLPRYPEEKLVEKQMEVEKRHKYDVYKTKTAGKTFSTASASLKKKAQWNDLGEGFGNKADYFLREGHDGIFFVERAERLSRPTRDERYDEEWTHDDSEVVYVANNRYKVFQLAKELGFNNPATPHKDSVEYEIFCEEDKDNSGLNMEIYNLVAQAYEQAVQFLSQNEGEIRSEYDLFE